LEKVPTDNFPERYTCITHPIGINDIETGNSPVTSFDLNNGRYVIEVRMTLICIGDEDISFFYIGKITSSVIPHIRSARESRLVNA